VALRKNGFIFMSNNGARKMDEEVKLDLILLVMENIL